MPKKVDSINIPAYQRKRSLRAKARKRPSYTPVKKRTTRKKRVSTVKEIDLSETLPSQELFPDPLMEEEFEKLRTKRSGRREMKLCGICEGYFEKIDVAVIQVTSPLRQGDSIIFEKEGGLFEQEISSMQIERKDVTLARSGSDIGIKVIMKPTIGAPVYKVL